MNELTCKKCGYVAQTKAGLHLHAYRKHTRKGKALSKRASRVMLDAKYGKSGAKHKKAARRHVIAPPREQVNFCPACGYHLEKVAIAMAFNPNE